MATALIWLGAFALLLTGLVWPLMQANRVVVPLSRLAAYLLCEICVFSWLWQGGWSKGLYGLALCSFFMVGLFMIYQAFGKRRWFIFMGGSFYSDMDAYAQVATALARTVQLERLTPAAVILRYEGWLGLAVMPQNSQDALLKAAKEALEGTRWCAFGLWQKLFAVQWLVMMVLLGASAIHLIGGN